MGLYFGTDGLRGIVNEDLTYETAFKCGNALSFLKKNPKVVIGRDTRGVKVMRLDDAKIATVTIAPHEEEEPELDEEGNPITDENGEESGETAQPTESGETTENPEE